jgi:glucose/arabinose dehydrogenase
MNTKLFCQAALALFASAGFAPGPDPVTSPAEITLTLPAGFQATTIVPELGRNRHLAVHSNGDIYVKLERLKDEKGILVLRDANGDGRYEIVNSFGNYGGTGIAIRDGYLYASSNEQVFRYTFNSKNEITNPENPEVIVTGLVAGRQHNTKSLAFDNAGNMYVTIGAPSNACQVQDRGKDSPGQDPCPILETAGGIWQFSASKPNQSYADGMRYSTGIRNVVGLDWNNSVNELYAMQHGRDQLFQLYPGLYDEKQSAELPAEEMFLVTKGSNFGWPYCYYDQFQQKKILAPEYGGDGKKQERCENVDKPLIGFPGHWAPNALLFYTGKMFPEKYKNGAFIAFHGSWNRAPLEQQGYKVVFVPFDKKGKPSGDWEVFANGFAGTDSVKSTRDAVHRPCGLAQGPDGALYISDSVKGRIWKIVYAKKSR